MNKHTYTRIWPYVSFFQGKATPSPPLLQGWGLGPGPGEGENPGAMPNPRRPRGPASRSHVSFLARHPFLHQRRRELCWADNLQGERPINQQAVELPKQTLEGRRPARAGPGARQQQPCLGPPPDHHPLTVAPKMWQGPTRENLAQPPILQWDCHALKGPGATPSSRTRGLGSAQGCPLLPASLALDQMVLKQLMCCYSKHRPVSPPSPR